MIEARKGYEHAAALAAISRFGQYFVRPPSVVINDCNLSVCCLASPTPVGKCLTFDRNSMDRWTHRNSFSTISDRIVQSIAVKRSPRTWLTHNAHYLEWIRVRSQTNKRPKIHWCLTFAMTTETEAAWFKPDRRHHRSLCGAIMVLPRLSSSSLSWHCLADAGGGLALKKCGAELIGSTTVR